MPARARLPTAASTPVAVESCAYTLIVAVCCVLCAKSETGARFVPSSYSSRVMGSTSGPTFARNATSPSPYMSCTAERLGWSPKTPHGCVELSASIASSSSRASATSARTSAYSAYMSFSPHCECGTSTL